MAGWQESGFDNVDLAGGTFHEGGFKAETGPRLVQPLLDLNHKLSDHEGQLKSFSGTVSAVQSSFSSWITVVIGFGAALLAGFTIIGAFEVYSSQKIDSRTDVLATKIDSGIETLTKRTDIIDRRMEGLSSEVKQLPSAISRELIGVARDISEINRPQERRR